MRTPTSGRALCFQSGRRADRWGAGSGDRRWGPFRGQTLKEAERGRAEPGAAGTRGGPGADGRRSGPAARVAVPPALVAELGAGVDDSGSCWLPGAWRGLKGQNAAADAEVCLSVRKKDGDGTLGGREVDIQT